MIPEATDYWTNNQPPGCWSESQVYVQWWIHDFNKQQFCKIHQTVDSQFTGRQQWLQARYTYLFAICLCFTHRYVRQSTSSGQSISVCYRWISHHSAQAALTHCHTSTLEGTDMSVAAFSDRDLSDHRHYMTWQYFLSTTSSSSLA